MGVTIKDIAHETGLGLATISSYLNGNKVREFNAIAIADAVKKLGYVPNEFARSLKTKKSMTIGILVPELDNMFSMTIISEMDRMFRSKGYGVIVCDSKSSVAEEMKSIKFLVSKMVDGLIVMPVSNTTEIYELPLSRNIPVVIIDRLTDEDKIPHVVINNSEISEIATDQICSAGHENIAIITGDNSIYTSNKREEGYTKSLKKQGLYCDKYVFRTELTPSGGYTAMKRIINEFPEVTAVFIANYEITIGTLMAINECGMSVYNDYSIVGFDALELSKIINPRLTIVNQPTENIGKVAAEIILRNIEGTVTITDDTILSAELLVGKSIKNI